MEHRPPWYRCCNRCGFVGAERHPFIWCPYCGKQTHIVYLTNEQLKEKRERFNNSKVGKSESWLGTRNSYTKKLPKSSMGGAYRAYMRAKTGNRFAYRPPNGTLNGDGRLVFRDDDWHKVEDPSDTEQNGDPPPEGISTHSKERE